MKILGFIFFFSLLTLSSFGQQYLWSTVEQDTITEKYVPIENATNEILKFYDHYEKHYDFSGFSKKRILEKSNYGFENLNWVNQINELTVFALRSNMGKGSIVIVMFVSSKNINMIIFSNQIVEMDLNYLPNDEEGREKFETWLKTLMN